jgi:hypothetical protein
VPSGFLNLSPKLDVTAVVGMIVLSFVRLGLTLIVPGLAVLQHGQVVTVSTLCTMQHGHSHELFEGLNAFNEGEDFLSSDGVITDVAFVVAITFEVSDLDFSLVKIEVEFDKDVLVDDNEAVVALSFVVTF